MTLIAILVSLLLERLLNQVQDLRRYERYQDYVGWMRQRLRGDTWAGPLGVLALLAPGVLAMLLVQAGLDGVLFGLLSLLLAIAVLLFCLGPRDLGLEAARYREAHAAGDPELATRLARDLLGYEPPEAPDEQARAVTEAVLVQANTRIFGVLFWFAVLGPVGAVLYRAVTELRRHTLRDGDAFAESAGQLGEILDWLPAHLAALGYALSGDFEAAVLGWRDTAPGRDRWRVLAAEVLVAAGSGALDLAPDAHGTDSWDRNLRAAPALVWRTLVVWVFVIALLTLAGWTS
ncbi:MAG: regulatory signaling modulator protein AmpE [Gammaproteobacteria bacterium]